MRLKTVASPILAVALGFLMTGRPVARGADDSETLATREKEECRQHLRKVYEAIQCYRRENKDLPNWLSDLVPKFLSDTNLLICPVFRRTGQTHPFAVDPVLKTSYGYQFRAAPMGGLWGGGDVTMKDWKRKQMGLIGGNIPMIRCYLHGETVLNAAFNGTISEGELQWENAFTNVVDIEDFRPENLMKREKAESVPAPAPAAASAAEFAAMSASEQFQALNMEFTSAQRTFSAAYGKAKTDEERQKIATELYPQPQKFAKRFMAVAEKSPDDPVAIDALIWVVTQVRYGPEADRAISVLLDRHIKSEKIKALAEALPNSPAQNPEKALRDIMAQNPSHEVQGAACYSLATILARNPGKEKEADQLFNQVIDRFGDIQHYNGSLAASARNELFELHNLSIGKPAPEIEGEDVDAKEFKLTSYKGKVVLIDFWGDW